MQARSCLLRSGFWKHHSWFGLKTCFSHFIRITWISGRLGKLHQITTDWRKIFAFSYLRHFVFMSKKYHKNCESCPTEMSTCPGKSSLYVLCFSCPVCPFFPICGIFLQRWWPNVSTMKCRCRVLMAVFVRKLEVVRKQVGGCLISSSLPCLCCQEHGGYLMKYAHYAVAITLNWWSWFIQSVR